METNFNTKLKESIIPENKIPIVSTFDKNLNIFSIRISSNKVKPVEAAKQLNDPITSYTKLINKLARKLSQLPTKENRFLLDTYYFNHANYQIYFIF